jgi:thioredoxin-like negative regulator of GroEL
MRDFEWVSGGESFARELAASVGRVVVLFGDPQHHALSQLTLWGLERAALGSPGTRVAVVGGDSSRLWARFGVSASPTVVVFEGGRVVRRLVGPQP